ncbi:unnamed protein product, partial [Brenthis ino]
MPYKSKYDNRYGVICRSSVDSPHKRFIKEKTPKTTKQSPTTCNPGSPLRKKRDNNARPPIREPGRLHPTPDRKNVRKIRRIRTYTHTRHRPMAHSSSRQKSAPQRWPNN